MTRPGFRRVAVNVVLTLAIAIALGGPLTLAVAEEDLRPLDRVQRRTNVAPQNTSKIVGGQLAVPGKFPFQVALIASSIDEGEEHFGQFYGGSLIERDWVLAHCVPDTREAIRGAELPSLDRRELSALAQAVHRSELRLACEREHIQPALLLKARTSALSRPRERSAVAACPRLLVKSPSRGKPDGRREAKIDSEAVRGSLSGSPKWTPGAP